MADSEAILVARGLEKLFPVRSGLFGRARAHVRAVDGVDLDVWAGESFAIVGESGSGKTTLGRCIMRLIEPTAGTVTFDGTELTGLSSRQLRANRRHFQMVFQDPYGSLNPRLTIGRAVEEPMRVHNIGSPGERKQRVAHLLETVGLSASTASRYPHEFSGGQRQRVGIARALASKPRLLVADEPVSALDVSVQAQIINLLAELQADLGLTLVFIGHDLSVVEQLADRVAVMYLGQIVEEAPADALFGQAQHPYTVSLLSAVPRPDPSRRGYRLVLQGDPPNPADPPPGCRFHTRCPIADDRCRRESPSLVRLGGTSESLRGHRVACHYPGALKPDGTTNPS